MKELGYQKFSEMDRRLEKRRPLNGQIELTYRCNLNCVHCYCKGSEKKGRELITKQWKKILAEIHREGCLWLTITGGDPLLRRDFVELYTFAYKKGFLINIFTNAMEVPNNVFSLFQKMPPLNVEISFYSYQPENYEAITRIPGSFAKVRKNIDRFIALKIPIVLKVVGLRQNKNDVIATKKFVEELIGKKKFKFDSFVFPRLDGNREHCQHRLSAKEILAIEKSDKDMIAQRKKQAEMDRQQERPNEFLYRCNNWRTNFYINPFGRLQFCHLTKKFSVDLKKKSFAFGFYKVFPRLLNEKFKTNSKCLNCRWREKCYRCPARAFLEVGNEEGAVDYYCQLAKTNAPKK